jgi:molybdopterin converting factor small subunit
MTQYHEFKKLQSINFAINEDYQEDNFQIHEGDEVVIIPPVSGG